MATVRKFMFDLDFDDPDAVARAERPQEPEPEEPEEVEPEIVVPTFSEEELLDARKEGYREGFEAGRREAAKATEEKLLASVETCAHRIADVYNAQYDANREIAKEMITVANAIARKMFPDLNARNALGEVERVVQETLSAISEEPRVQIMLPPELREPFLERLSSMTSRAGFDGKVFVNPDPSLNAGDCRIEWSNGAAVRDSDALWEMIDNIVHRNIHGDEEEGGESPTADTAQAAPGTAEATPPTPEADTTGTADAAPDEAPRSDMAEADNIVSEQLVDDHEQSHVEEGDALHDGTGRDDMERRATGSSVDPLSPEMQAAILDGDIDADDANGDDDKVTPEQET